MTAHNTRRPKSFGPARARKGTSAAHARAHDLLPRGPPQSLRGPPQSSAVLRLPLRRSRAVSLPRICTPLRQRKSSSRSAGSSHSAGTKPRCAAASAPPAPASLRDPRRPPPLLSSCPPLPGRSALGRSRALARKGPGRTLNATNAILTERSPAPTLTSLDPSLRSTEKVRKVGG